MCNYSFLVTVVLWMDYFCAFLITTQSNWFYFSWLFLKLFKAFFSSCVSSPFQRKEWLCREKSMLDSCICRGESLVIIEELRLNSEVMYQCLSAGCLQVLSFESKISGPFFGTFDNFFNAERQL